MTATEGYAADGRPPQPFLPFYAANDLSRNPEHRVSTTSCGANPGSSPRAPGSAARDRATRPRHLYFPGRSRCRRPMQHGLRQIGLDLLCTNRDLPLSMPVGKQHTDFTLGGERPGRLGPLHRRPRAPRPCRSDGDYAWRFISHLGLNYLSLDRLRRRPGRRRPAGTPAPLHSVDRLDRRAPARRSPVGQGSADRPPHPGQGPVGRRPRSGDHAHARRERLRQRRRHPARRGARPVLRQIRSRSTPSPRPCCERPSGVRSCAGRCGWACARCSSHGEIPAEAGPSEARIGSNGAMLRQLAEAPWRVRLLPGDAPAGGDERRPAALRPQRPAGAGSGPPGTGALGIFAPSTMARPGRTVPRACRPRLLLHFLRPVRSGRSAAAASDRIRPRSAPQRPRPDLPALRRYFPPPRRSRCSIAPGPMSRPTVSFDRPEEDRFAAYVGALIGLGMDSLRERDAMPRPDQAAFRRAAREPDAPCRGSGRDPLRILHHAGAYRVLHRRLAHLARAPTDQARPARPRERTLGRDLCSAAGSGAGSTSSASCSVRSGWPIICACCPAAEFPPADPDRTQLCRRHAALGRQSGAATRGGAADRPGPPGPARLDNLADAGRRQLNDAADLFLDASAESFARKFDFHPARPAGYARAAHT